MQISQVFVNTYRIFIPSCPEQSVRDREHCLLYRQIFTHADDLVNANTSVLNLVELILFSALESHALTEYRPPDQGAGVLIRGAARFRTVFFHSQPIAFKVLAIIRRHPGVAMAANE